VLVLGGFRAAHRVMVGVRLEGVGGGGAKGGGAQAGAAAATATARGGERDDDEDNNSAYVWIVNAHLDHADPATRAQQAAAIIRWMGSVQGGGQEDKAAAAAATTTTNNNNNLAAAVVLAGDFNAPEGELGVHGALRSAGFVSAHATAHGGKEPARTWPTGLKAPLADDEGEPHCADYIYVRELGVGGKGAAKMIKGSSSNGRAAGGGGGGGDKDDKDELRVRVLSARVAADEPWPDDPTLYPSDHAAIRTVLQVERRRRRKNGQGRRGRDVAAAEEGF
jgi:hypothetical protein